MKKISFFFTITFLIFSLVSCKVDFSPNAEWKDVPSVWCVLDQSDDTTWVRVQRCYLGNDNLYNYTQIYDSLYYPEGAIAVLLEKWPAKSGVDGVLTLDGDAPIDSLSFTYTLREDKDTGLFSGGSQPLFCARTANWLHIDYIYRLVVRNLQTNTIIASAYTQLVGLKYDQTTGDADLTTLEQPNPNIVNSAYRQFRFSGSPAKCTLRWKTLVRGRLYQPMVRFYYYHRFLGADNVYHNDTSALYHVDVQVSSVKRTDYVNELSTDVYESTYMSAIKNTILSNGDTNKKGFCDTVDIFLAVCNEDLSAYITSTEPSNTIVQDRVTYTNINDGKGVGIFAARRAHFRYRVPTNAESGPGTYHDALKQLNIGFE